MKNNVNKIYRNSKSNNNIQYLKRFVQKDLHSEIEISKLNFCSRITYRLNHMQKNSKIYWALLKRIFSKKIIPFIPTAFNENDIITDFKKKSELFNSKYLPSFITQLKKV